MKRILIAFSAACILTVYSCKDSSETSEQQTTGNTADTAAKAVVVPDFNADSAYDFVAAQVAMGPRNPGSPGQKICADWMQQKLKAWCDTVYRQETTVKAWDGKVLPCINLVGVINPKASKRILLLAHWDSRPWADQDTKDKDKPILAADDAGSGVAVLLEIARALKGKTLSPELGVDILMTDVEDYGYSEQNAADAEKYKDSYCLGTQYWAKNPHILGYRADFGILLDMVGAHGSVFPLEATSTEYAGNVQQMVWQLANKAGYSSFFPFKPGGGVTDDHKYVNELAHIPTIDIISMTDHTETTLPAHWHTHNDNLAIIDRNTLKAVGQTLLHVIYESVPTLN